MVTQRINQEIHFLEESEYANLGPIQEYIIYLKSRIGIDKPDNKLVTHYDAKGNRTEIKKMNLDEYMNNDMVELSYQKPWNKLREFHKIVKIKEYVDSLSYKKEKIANRDFLKKELVNGLKEKKFGKGKSEIVYDSNSMKIESISCVGYLKKKDLYEIDWRD